MAGGFRTNPSGDDRVIARIKALEAQVKKLTNPGSINNSVIGNGGQLTVIDEDGNVVATIGHDSTNDRGVAFTSPAGVDMLDFFVQSGTGEPFMVINDSKGNQAFVTDSGGDGTGIWWPQLPIVFGNMTISNWGSTSSGSFSTIHQAQVFAPSQGIYVVCRSIANSGATAGQARLLVNGSQVGSTASIGTSFADATFGPALHGVADLALCLIELQARVTAGAGNALLEPYQANWRNSSL